LAPRALPAPEIIAPRTSLSFRNNESGPQKMPGRVLCAYYDLGGQGVAYHDTDPHNHGSGELNPDDGTYLNEFRFHEGVDTIPEILADDPVLSAQRRRP
jgi:hypothetical protein